MMVKRLLNTIVALPVALSLIVASSGITVFLHHCDCEGKTIFSLYHEVGCSMNQHPQPAFHSCCDFENVQVKSDNESCGCSNDEISIKPDDISPSTSPNNTFVKTLLVAKLFDVESNVSKIQLTETANLYTESESPPPKLWGKTMLIRYSSLKTYHINS